MSNQIATVIVKSLILKNEEFKNFTERQIVFELNLPLAFKPEEKMKLWGYSTGYLKFEIGTPVYAQLLEMYLKFNRQGMKDAVSLFLVMEDRSNNKDIPFLKVYSVPDVATIIRYWMHTPYIPVSYADITSDLSLWSEKVSGMSRSVSYITSGKIDFVLQTGRISSFAKNESTQKFFTQFVDYASAYHTGVQKIMTLFALILQEKSGIFDSQVCNFFNGEINTVMESLSSIYTINIDEVLN